MKRTNQSNKQKHNTVENKQNRWTVKFHKETEYSILDHMLKQEIQ